jgi:hypothetical protein
VHHDLISHPYSLDGIPERINNTGSVTTPHMEIPEGATALSDGHHIYGSSPCSPNIVVIDTRGHDGHHHFVRTGLWHRHLLDLEGFPGITETFRSHYLGEHPLGKLPEFGKFAKSDYI